MSATQFFALIAVDEWSKTLVQNDNDFYTEILLTVKLRNIEYSCLKMKFGAHAPKCTL